MLDNVKRADDPHDYPFRLNPWHRPISTSSNSAQKWFDRGLNWIYGFNHEEAVECFRKSLEFDPDCAMAWWGIAYASGPFYNRPWARLSEDEVAQMLRVCHEAAMRANSLSGRCARVERDLIRATVRRYPSASPEPLDTLDSWHCDFAESMRRVHAEHSHDLDMAALCAEASMTRTPRQMWNIRTGDPMPGTDIREDVRILEEAIRRNSREGGPVHPGLRHLLIHAVEMSNSPEKAMCAADDLRALARDEGHLHHMAAHVYTLCGDYARSVAVSVRAVQANDKYESNRGARNFYTTSRCHDLHLLMHASMFLGHYRHAIRAADRLVSIATPELVEDSFPYMASILDGYSSMRTHVFVRFGQWKELIDDPIPERPFLFPVGVAMREYGKGVAHAARGDVNEAEFARERFLKARLSIPDDAVLLNNATRDVLDVGEAMLCGEIEYRKGNFAAAFTLLGQAVDLDDSLNFTEPWAWMHPPRHALGALLAEQGRFGEAEQVYREDLGFDSAVPRCRQHPDNVWALHGLRECLQNRNASESEIGLLRQRLEFALARADSAINSSCACRSTRATAKT
ncbi:MAG: hypothetical protein OXC26_09605 [Albidovulum sp.]|nr:hypothetical protein [Albidovulum sp.]